MFWASTVAPASTVRLFFPPVHLDNPLTRYAEGIDVALCRISSASNADVAIRLLSYCEVPVSPELRTRILGLTRPGAQTTLADVCDLNFSLGNEFARAILHSGVDLSQVDIIASHGQTLWHSPFGRQKSTLQMAESSVIAHATKRSATPSESSLSSPA